MDILWILLGLVMILIGSDKLVDGASEIARRFGISEFVIGMTIVGIGTSMPELVSSVLSAIGGHGDMALGNVTGSNICNTLLILGVTALIIPIPFTKSNIRVDIPMCIGVSLLLVALLYNFFIGDMPMGISRFDGVLLVVGFILFMIYSFRTAKNAGDDEAEDEKVKSIPMWLAVTYVVLGLLGLIFGGHFFVEHTVSIAHTFHVSEAFISITLMAIGTSLPELATCVVAALKKKNQLALGNIIGSNIFNVLLIIGVSSVISPFEVETISAVDMGMFIVSQIALLSAAFVFKKGRLSKADGVIFLLLYFGYMGWLFASLA